MFALSFDYHSTEAWPINSVRLMLVLSIRLIGEQSDHCSSTYQVISNFSEKTLEHERILGKPVLCIAFPLGETAWHDERQTTNANKALTHLGNISAKEYIQPYASRVSPRATSDARAFQLEQRLGHLPTPLAEGGN